MMFIPVLGVRASGKTTLINSIVKKQNYFDLLDITGKNLKRVNASKISLDLMNSKLTFICQMGYVVKNAPFDFHESLIEMYGEQQTKIIKKFLEKSDKVILVIPSAKTIEERMTIRMNNFALTGKENARKKWKILINFYSIIYPKLLHEVYYVLYQRFPQALFYDGFQFIENPFTK
jgi:hypothetical protein